MDIKDYEKWFRDFARQKISQCAGEKIPMLLKVAHTFKVYANAGKIVAKEGLSGEMARAALLAALFHDIARFDQYLEFGTFKDALSFNHGLKGAEILRAANILKDEKPATARLAVLAIGLHNRKEIPANLRPEQELVCKITRDSDKLDILRVMDIHLAKKPYNPTVVLSLPDSSAHNPKVACDAMAKRCASYDDLQSVNDFRVLLGSWYYSLNFNSSREIFLADGYGQKLVAALPDNETYGDIKKYLLNFFMNEAGKKSQNRP